MAYLSYNLSETIISNLSAIEELRKQILLIPLSPRNKLKIRWETNISRVYWGLTLLDNPLTRKDIAKLLSASPKRKLNNFEKDVLSQNRTFSYIRENWLVSKSLVTIPVLRKLYDLACKETLGRQGSFTQISEKAMTEVLEYLAEGGDHPIIQAGIAQAQTTNIALFDNGNGRISRLVDYLYLYKYGYDFRGFLILDEFFRKDPVSYRRAQETTIGSKNQSLWLEYFTGGIALQLQKALTDIKNQKFQADLPSSFWNINERQKQILNSLEQPGARVTNKNVQKLFGVSQITASRDLAKLTTLGLLFSHGKGRSVYYTKV